MSCDPLLYEDDFSTNFQNRVSGEVVFILGNHTDKQTNRQTETSYWRTTAPAERVVENNYEKEGMMKMNNFNPLKWWATLLLLVYM